MITIRGAIAPPFRSPAPTKPDANVRILQPTNLIGGFDPTYCTPATNLIGGFDPTYCTPVANLIGSLGCGLGDYLNCGSHCLVAASISSVMSTMSS